MGVLPELLVLGKHDACVVGHVRHNIYAIGHDLSGALCEGYVKVFVHHRTEILQHKNIRIQRYPVALEVCQMRHAERHQHSVERLANDGACTLDLWRYLVRELHNLNPRHGFQYALHHEFGES